MIHSLEDVVEARRERSMMETRDKRKQTRRMNEIDLKYERK
jgi:hypothetical protein